MTAIPYDTISLKIKHRVNEVLAGIAEKQDRSKSSLIRKIIAEYIEDQEDIISADQAMKDYNKNRKSYSLADIKKDNDL